EVDARLAALDAPLRERFLTAYRSDARLCFVARFDAGRGASVALRALPLSNPLVSGHGTENRAAIFSDRYREQPLVVQGPGAGAARRRAAHRPRRAARLSAVRRAGAGRWPGLSIR